MIDLGPSTNKGVAIFRILHDREEAPLLQDSYLDWFFPPEQLNNLRKLPPMPAAPPDDPDEHFFWNAYWWTNLRERYVDDILTAAIEHGCRQVLSLGAGYDTRFFRLGWQGHPPIRLIEVDLPATVDEKCRCIVNNLGKMPENLAIVSLDLATTTIDKLVEYGFDPAVPTAFLMQGLSYYLPKVAFEALVSRISAYATPGSVFVYDNCHEEMTYDNDLVPGIAASIRRLVDIGEPYLFAEPPTRAVERLARGGWDQITHLEAQDLQPRYGRERSLSALMWYIIKATWGG